MDAAPPNSQTEAAEDRILMARLQAGDESALAALMERWELPTKAVIGRLVLNESEAEELAQEAFVRVWQQRDKFRGGADFRPWLFAIAINLARNRLRWWRRRPSISLQAWSENEGGPPERAEERIESQRIDVGSPLPVERTGAENLEQAERAAAVCGAIAALPTDLREAIVLFEYEEMSHVEIAAVVGASPKAVETRIYRAREKLRTALSGIRQ